MTAVRGYMKFSHVTPDSCQGEIGSVPIDLGMAKTKQRKKSATPAHLPEGPGSEQRFATS